MTNTDWLISGSRRFYFVALIELYLCVFFLCLVDLRQERARQRENPLLLLLVVDEYILPLWLSALASA